MTPASTQPASSSHRSSIAAIVLVDGCPSSLQSLASGDGIETVTSGSGNALTNASSFGSSVEKQGGSGSGLVAGSDKDPGFVSDYEYDESTVSPFDAFTAAYGSSCLVPVGNKSLLWYSLRRLECAGFRNVYVAVQGEQQSKTVANWVNEKTKHKTIDVF